MSKGTRLLLAAILALIGGLMLRSNVQYILATSDASIGVLLQILIGVIVMWSGWRVFHSQGRPSGCILLVIAALCIVYIAVPILHAKGVIATQWANTDNQAFNMVVAGIALVFTLGAGFRKP